MFDLLIPKISDEEMMKRYQSIKPVITMDGKLYHFREYTLEEMKGNSYFYNRAEDVREEVLEEELQVWEGRDFVCLHKYGYHGIFNPSVGEVLAQINVCDIPFVRAFEIIEWPEIASDLRKDSFRSIAFDKGYHVSTVRLYLAKQ